VKARAAVAALVVAAAVALGAGGGGGGEDGAVVQAEFSSARGLVEGNDVRVGGAPAGTVESLELTDRGTALVTLRLHDGIDPPRADASAAIRPVDLIGDSYVALEPGTDPRPLAEPIGPARTLNAPRLDDLLRSFDEPAREGLRAILVESGIALDGRGADLNGTALALRPALKAADSVMAELGSQTADLREFVSAAERVTAQGAARRDDLGRLVSALDTTLHATADRTQALDAALARLPGSVEDLGVLAPRLTAVAREALPLAESLQGSAPGLADAAAQAGPFLDTAGDTIDELNPVIDRGTDVLARSDPTLVAFDRAFARMTQTGPEYERFLDALVPAAPAISEGFFVNFPDQAAEPGDQPFDPFADPRRHYWRGAAIFSCQSFGVPIEPGCLQKLLDRGGRRGDEGDADAGPAPEVTGEGGPDGGGPSATAPAHGSDAGEPEGLELPDPPDLSDLPGGDPAAPVQDLLDSLLGP
jgi:phospholipid/cholesterol/gamma-HCH transport system substrate-binding protein